ncbi:MAG: hypothetical protein Q8J68_08080 [Methanolobus sp.]|uniref:hypothetical protein n=1 Tax=Methanolobus sp. TaxID=1874737 RepID=UPI002731D1FE|nr:hypothetical protein [Methanolobus sp.]MDP2217227.1 hypothetical protein [Methanolobus sp.]
MAGDLPRGFCNLAWSCSKKDCRHHSEHVITSLCGVMYCSHLGKNCKCQAV